MKWLLLGTAVLSVCASALLLCVVSANRGIAEEERKHGLN